MYRRVELADKEGYLVRVRRSAGKAEITVQLEIARRTLSGGKYDEAIRAFVGRPMLTKTVVTRTVPLTRDKATLVYWETPSHATAPVRPKRAPSWAVGEWGVTALFGERVERDVLTVQTNGGIAFAGVPGLGSVGAAGELTYKVTEYKLTTTMTGRLRPDGTGGGTGYAESYVGREGEHFFWTASKGQGLARQHSALDWAVGEWEMTGPTEETGLLSVNADGSVLWTRRTDSGRPPGAPRVMYGSGIIDSGGQVEIKATLAGHKMSLSGTLNHDGTGSGMLRLEGDEGDTAYNVRRFGAIWRAMKVHRGLFDVSGTQEAFQEQLKALLVEQRRALEQRLEEQRRPETKQGAPPWAVGEWELTTSASHDRFTVNVLPDGTMVGFDSTYKSGNGTIDPNGHLRYRVTLDDQVGTMTGALTPEGTGGGRIHQEGDAPPGVTPFGAFWTAKQTLQPIPHAEPPVTELPAPDAVPAVSIPQAAPGPAGVAVLLEIGPAAEVPQIPEQIRALIEQTGPAIQIECKFVEIQKDPDQPLARDWQDNPELWLREQLNAGKARVIWMPRITTRNGVPAKAEFTADIPYFYATISYDEFGKRTVEHEPDTVSVVQSISVTPTLQADGQILMDIDFRIDSQVRTVVGPNQQTIPILTTQSGSTQARVADGKTLVIGGISGSGEVIVPKPPATQGPVLTGELFRQRLASQRDTELLIFVTPKVISGASPLSLPDLGVITGEIRNGEQWVWDIINLGYPDATHIVGLTGGYIYAEGSTPVTPSPPAIPGPYPHAPPVAGPALQLPEGMDPPIAIRAHNVLLVHGTPKAIDQFREIVSVFDRPIKQVEIEARFVEVDTQRDRAFGIDRFVANGSAEFFNLGVFRPGSGINVARFRKGRFESELRALLEEGQAELINAPRVTARNNQPATVSFTREIPYTYATTTYYAGGKREVDLETGTMAITQALTVTPRILQDGSVELLLQGEIEDQVGTMAGPDGEVLPVVNSQAFSTQVRVPDGDTIVIGGLTRTRGVRDPEQVLPEETAEAEASQETKRVRKELLIFVTPRILSELPRQ